MTTERHHIAEILLIMTLNTITNYVQYVRAQLKRYETTTEKKEKMKYLDQKDFLIIHNNYPHRTNYYTPVIT